MRSTLPRLTLPYKLCRGSLADRQRLASRLVNKLFNNMQGGFKNGEMHVQKVQEYVDEVLPGAFNIKVRGGFEDSEFAASNDIYYSTFSQKAKLMTIELGTKKNKIKHTNLVDIMHEFRHVADVLFNPKYLVRNEYMVQEGLYTKKFDKLFDEIIYNVENIDSKASRSAAIKKVEHKVRKFLRGMSAEDKVNCLQDMRYSLESENFAYLTQYKVAKKLKKKHINISEDDLCKWHLDFMFIEKINLLKRIAFEVIQKERNKFARELLKKQN